MEGLDLSHWKKKKGFLVEINYLTRENNEKKQKDGMVSTIYDLPGDRHFPPVVFFLTVCGFKNVDNILRSLAKGNVKSLV